MRRAPAVPLESVARLMDIVGLPLLIVGLAAKHFLEFVQTRILQRPPRPW